MSDYMHSEVCVHNERKSLISTVLRNYIKTYGANVGLSAGAYIY